MQLPGLSRQWKRGSLAGTQSLVRVRLQESGTNGLSRSEAQRLRKLEASREAGKWKCDKACLFHGPRKRIPLPSPVPRPWLQSFANSAPCGLPLKPLRPLMQQKEAGGRAAAHAWSAFAISRLLRNRKEEGQPEAERGSKGQRLSERQHAGGTRAFETLPRHLRGFTTARHGFGPWHTTRGAPRKREGRTTRLPGSAIARCSPVCAVSLCSEGEDGQWMDQV